MSALSKTYIPISLYQEPRRPFSYLPFLRETNVGETLEDIADAIMRGEMKVSALIWVDVEAGTSGLATRALCERLAVLLRRQFDDGREISDDIADLCEAHGVQILFRAEPDTISDDWLADADLVREADEDEERAA